MKRLSIILLLTIMLTLVACTPKYIDSYSSSELAGIALGNIVTDGGTKVLDDDVILNFAEQKPSYIKDYIVIDANNTKNINEIGIFRCEDGHAEDWSAAVQNYVGELINRYRSMDYFPEEKEKYECATVKVMGNYVIYSFLNEADTEAFYNAIENTIKK